MKRCRFENQKLKFPHRTIRTNRTLALSFLASVLYGVSARCTVSVRCRTAVCNTEPLIYKGFVRNVRFVRRFLYTHIYRAYIFEKKAVTRARARICVFRHRTNRTNRTLPLILLRSTLYGVRFTPYKIQKHRTKCEVMA